jgi:predicted nucleotidyltransferase
MIQRSQITHFANAVAERFKPQLIVLFGSYAYGKPNQDSDVDLLIVMPEDRRLGRKAVEIREAIPANFPLDLLVRTPEDIQWRLAEGDCFLHEVLNKGKVMYEAPHA